MDVDVELPAGHRLVSLAEDPELRGPMGRHNTAVWPEFMFHDPVANKNWDRLFSDWAEFQVCLLDPNGDVAAAHNSAPLPSSDTPCGDETTASRSTRGSGSMPASAAASSGHRPDR